MSGSIDELITRGYEARRAHLPIEAKSAFAEAVALSRQAGARQEELAQALAGLGQIERDLNNGPAALACYQESVEILRHLNHPLKLAHTVRHVADILRSQGRSEAAEPLYDEALSIYRSQDGTPPLDLANALRGFALAKEHLGAARESLDLFREARSLYAAAGVEAGVAECDARTTK